MNQLPLLDIDATSTPALPGLDATGPAAPAVNPDQPRAIAVLDKVRKLVQDKTRFAPEDIQAIAETDTLQDYTLLASYSLEAHFESRVINGFFDRGAADRSCDYAEEVEAAARALSKPRLLLAANSMESHLRALDTPHDEIQAGLYLPHAGKHWHLDTCGGCGGDGSSTCHHCRGRKSETCDACQGGRSVLCSAYNCCGTGKINCPACGGSGQAHESASEYVTEQVPVVTYQNGSAHTTYRKESRMVHGTRQVHCHSCSHGKITCHTCSGSGNIHCVTCNASGNITCRTCSGRGDITCGPCKGSGKRGTAAWVDVYATPAYSVALPEQADDDSRAIVDKHDPHAIAALSQSLTLGKIALDDPAFPQRIDARYQGKLRIVRLQASCNGASHHIVAYGADLRWLSLDDIVEKLLQGDLQALGNALNHSADGGFFASDIDRLLLPLRDVAASELNGEVIESVLDGVAAHAHPDVVSPEYAQQLRSCMLGALRHIYTRLAKQFWWKNALAALAVALLAFLFSGALPAAVAGVLAAGAGLPVFGRRVRGVLTGALGSRRQVDRAIAIAGKGKRNRLAHALVLGPAIAAVLAAGHLLPERGPFAPAKAATNIIR
ncbi:hypothetical protein [Janthinobacterium agaricidamnosum]|uniref:Uncharacterized domain protein n=1 Tax=Janthinobacterium agaricidamnosum NBRC 102515 = DSM 9628 TaxID=1349767 RepID=W0V9I3_9BURK|nr:hypothetical protein [Janthinobacterium agaricidamnosum]CDG84275.1 putative uncharacterized domain protein [Janthinobacterium agaricidamnosum NBRC 102515 = DSM 9628]